jgi:3-phosphoshikimate 1-carboxyvinyltransferase
MLAACASIICEGEVVIADAQAVEKSYPAFFKDFAALGGEVKGA